MTFTFKPLACSTLLALLATSATAHAGPFLDFSFSAANFSENPEPFTFTFSQAYTLGPYDTLTHEFSTTISDLDGNGGAAAIPIDAFMSIPFIDAAAVGAAGLGSGCTPLDAPFFTNLVCDPFASTSVSVTTLTDGLFGVVVSFTLSGGDAIIGQGRVELLNSQAVPEPVTLSLLGLGLLVVAARRRHADSRGQRQ